MSQHARGWSDADKQRVAEWIAGQPLTLQAEVTNRGRAPIYRLRAITKSDNPIFDERELIFGRIDPGQTKTAKTPLGICAVPDSYSLVSAPIRLTPAKS